MPACVASTLQMYNDRRIDKKKMFKRFSFIETRFIRLVAGGAKDIATGVGCLGFHFRAGQIGHSVVNGLPSWAFAGGQGGRLPY